MRRVCVHTQGDAPFVVWSYHDQAVVIRENGPPENLVYETNFPTPKPADGQVLVKNEYTGINFIDT